MNRRILVSVDPYEARAALLEGDRLKNIELETGAHGKIKGNIYRGKVTAVEPSFEAAFVDYGTGKEGFLPFDEVCDRSLLELTGRKRGRSRAGVKVGDVVLVQVVKEEVGKKGAVLSMYVSLPGRYLVLMPFSDRTGVSRKLDEDERKRLRAVASSLDVPPGFGLIMRTCGGAALNQDEVRSDLEHLLRHWGQVIDRFKASREPGEVMSEAGLAVRFVRDYMTADVSEILVEDDQSMRELTRYLESVAPKRARMVKRYDGEIPLFIRYGIERQIDGLLKRKVPLPSGGSIVIGQTEALVAIDVNSGRMKKRGIEQTAYQTNMEAAREIARQVVLRDLGGIIVVDFIDMESDGRRREVEAELKNALGEDKARLTFGRITDFGLLAFSRQRLRSTMDSGVMTACPTCAGSGRIRSPSALAMSTLRRVRERLATAKTGQAAYVEVVAHIDVANFLNNRKREDLAALEKHYGVVLDVTGEADAGLNDIRVNVLPEVPPDRITLRGSEDEHEEDDVAGELEQEPEGREAGPTSILKDLLLRMVGVKSQAEEAREPAARKAGGTRKKKAAGDKEAGVKVSATRARARTAKAASSSQAGKRERATAKAPDSEGTGPKAEGGSAPGAAKGGSRRKKPRKAADADMEAARKRDDAAKGGSVEGAETSDVEKGAAGEGEPRKPSRRRRRGRRGGARNATKGGGEGAQEKHDAGHPKAD